MTAPARIDTRIRRMATTVHEACHVVACLVCHRYYAPEGQLQRCACRFDSPED